MEAGFRTFASTEVLSCFTLHWKRGGLVLEKIGD